MIIEIYKEYREKQKSLHSKILKNAVNRDRLIKAYEFLGIYKNGQVLLESEQETDLLFDFNVYEKIDNCKNAVELYLQNNEIKDKIEIEILSAMKNVEASLYQIKDIDRENHKLYLEDLLNVGKNISIIDIGFSETASLNMLIFCRIIELDQFNFTSGVAMLFPEEYKDYLLRKSKKITKKLNVEDNSMKRFISYFHLHRTDGLTTVFEDVVKGE